MPKLCSVCLCKCTRSLRKQAAASFPDERMPATRFPGAGCYCGRIGRAGHFSCCRMRKGTAASRAAPSFNSSSCHSAESLQQTITWFLYFISALSPCFLGEAKFPSETLLREADCSRGLTPDPLRQEGSIVGPGGRSRWIENRPAFQNYLNLSAPLLWLCKGHIKSRNI